MGGGEAGGGRGGQGSHGGPEVMRGWGAEAWGRDQRRTEELMKLLFSGARGASDSSFDHTWAQSGPSPSLLLICSSSSHLGSTVPMKGSCAAQEARWRLG